MVATCTTISAAGRAAHPHAPEDSFGEDRTPGSGAGIGGEPNQGRSRGTATTPGAGSVQPSCEIRRDGPNPGLAPQRWRPPRPQTAHLVSHHRLRRPHREPLLVSGETDEPEPRSPALVEPMLSRHPIDDQRLTRRPHPASDPQRRPDSHHDPTRAPPCPRDGSAAEQLDAPRRLWSATRAPGSASRSSGESVSARKKASGPRPGQP
jgi:hypothetical protein